MGVDSQKGKGFANKFRDPPRFEITFGGRGADPATLLYLAAK
jgi:hypothetical protein